ncbi:unnamed protein product [Pseudo-nitzschia multistriata]|uniref:Transmembrane protein n=1 Tax=Pseudo-nitzschia multistriata TaxID=183589 RepID=A0A448Z2B0_9STRA|nr:unnamed protein product [Pseudo-nitzschia multistriata]
MLRGIDGTKVDKDHKKEGNDPKTAAEEEEERMEHEILLAVLKEGRGERDERGEREEWSQHVGWHRKENVGVLKRQRASRDRGESAGPQRNGLGHNLRADRRHSDRGLDNDDRLPSSLLQSGGKLVETGGKHGFGSLHGKSAEGSLPMSLVLALAALFLFCFGVSLRVRNKASRSRIGGFRRRSTKGRTL